MLTATECSVIIVLFYSQKSLELALKSLRISAMKDAQSCFITALPLSDFVDNTSTPSITMLKPIRH